MPGGLASVDVPLIEPYARILRHPGAARFSAAAFVARLPISMVGLGIVLLISAVEGRYAVAGAVAAAYTLAAAFLNPLGSRLVDRWGQSRIVTVLVTVNVTMLLLLAYAATSSWPTIALIAFAALGGATQPATGALVRARWAAALGSHPSLRTAFAFESVLDEFIFIIGPPLATFIAVAIDSAAPLILCAALVGGGSLLLLVQRSSEPPPTPRAAASGGSLLRMAGVPVVVTAFIAIGSVFGSVDVVTVAAADAEGRRAAAGIVLAVYALGSMASALVLGSRSQAREDASLPRHLLIAAAALAVVTVPLVFVSGLVAIGAMVLLAGLTVSPVLITGFALVERLVAPARLTEGLTWATSGIGLGVALSAALSGWLVDHFGLRAGFLVTAVSALVTLAVTAIGYRSLVRGTAGGVRRIADPRRT